MGHASLIRLDADLVTSAGARCLDGSGGGFYWRAASSAQNGTKLVVFLQGGGECRSATECAVWDGGAGRGSAGWPKTKRLGEDELSDDSSVNPHFHDWNKLFVPYCSADMHSGTRLTPSHALGGGYFAGHNLINATLAQLRRSLPALAPSLVLLSGSSAGGIGVLLHADYFAAAWPAATVKAAPAAGFFYPAVSSERDFINGDATPARRLGEASKCTDAAFAWRALATPLFVRENQYDTAKLANCGCDASAALTANDTSYLRQWGRWDPLSRACVGRLAELCHGLRGRGDACDACLESHAHGCPSRGRPLLRWYCGGGGAGGHHVCDVRIGTNDVASLPPPSEALPRIPTVTIAPGVEMPLINLGGVHSHPSNYSAWLQLGGRGLDTAMMYGDDVQVGDAVAASGLPREELFLTSKVPCCPAESFTSWCVWYDKEYKDLDAYTRSEIDTRLLGVARVDLLLLHWPCATMEETVATYRSLERFALDGKASAIGISNFNASAIDALFAAGLTVPPAVNQVGFSIGGHSESRLGRDLDTLRKCREKGIAFSAYSPLGGLSGVDVLHHPRVLKVAAAHNRSASQVALRWVTQQGVVAVSASSNPAHLASDLGSFSFNLTGAEMKALAEI
ncbi:hypothetical protein EMIHUDRAFT_238572 [Emiliania huxleyi CCMP1516]|uniref:NADP-dependent oxidoreductase domain-containing protein n=2 Tax=Emiliania huxleyi TaxID=2903 RepID=A0A0D3JLG1_EMIH1|nr:hypothetical protein EMIHUDRAFT_238572 [Emiliania huxleyi CCMP1516]EOD24346.1 hypothetical protein EMIHUDRAFT_238572 [Emiliania huxleyi CCMP1516]|eukprot:XP_005776775.1 hypothetical protein EMIHUDRAFT_238572 [Emiliania huxleyi CCMP1516]